MEEQSLTITRHGKRTKLPTHLDAPDTKYSVAQDVALGYGPTKCPPLTLQRSLMFSGNLFSFILCGTLYATILTLLVIATIELIQGKNSATNADMALLAIMGACIGLYACQLIFAASIGKFFCNNQTSQNYLRHLTLLPCLSICTCLACDKMVSKTSHISRFSCRAVANYFSLFCPQEHETQETLTISSTLVNEGEKDEENYRGTDIEEGPQGDATESYQMFTHT